MRAKAMKNEGLPIGCSYKASFLVGDRIAVVKGAPNLTRQGQLRFTRYALNWQPFIQ